MVPLRQTGWKSHLHFLVEVWGPERELGKKGVTKEETREKKDGRGRRWRRRDECKKERGKDTITQIVYMTKHTLTNNEVS